MADSNFPGGTPIVDPLDDNTEVDLDNFLNFKTSNAEAQQAKVAGLEMPKADRLVVVGFGIDDSSSMRGSEDAVRNGIRAAVDAFKGAKGSDFYLILRGFTRIYFQGFISKLTSSIINSYSADCGNTPLITLSINLMQQAREVADQYRNAGISTSVAALIITDGEPNGETCTPGNFAKYIQPTDYIVGMGVRQSESDASAEIYQDLFKKMGIKTPVMTPTSNPATIRHAINQFSQSVASIATGGVSGAMAPKAKTIGTQASDSSAVEETLPKKKIGRLF